MLFFVEIYTATGWMIVHESRDMDLATAKLNSCIKEGYCSRMECWNPDGKHVPISD